MQLKRDVDYALRLILKLKEKTDHGAVTLSGHELSSETGVPYIICSRILNRLAESGLVCAGKYGKDRIRYHIGAHTDDISLFYFINMIEGKTELFAAFDMMNPVYRINRQTLSCIDDKIKDCLNGITLGDLFYGNK